MSARRTPGGWRGRHAIHLESLGGTEDGVIGALAAVGLAAGGDDGRVVQIGAWPDDLFGPQDLATLHARGVECVVGVQSNRAIDSGRIDVGKHLRPNYRSGKIVLFVEPIARPTADGDGTDMAGSSVHMIHCPRQECIVRTWLVYDSSSLVPLAA